MSNIINRFAVSLSLLAIVCQLGIIFGFQKITGKEPSLLVNLFPTYFLIINLLIHFLLLKAAHQSANKFVNAFMGLTTAKMLISLIFIVIIAMVLKPNFKAEVITFALLYLFFMVLEVVFILKDLKKLKNKD